jgi:hypothetical protein
MMKELLDGGEILSAGARALIEGGYQSLPKVEMPGAMLIGDSAGLLNVPKIKGTHQAMKSGMLAAEHLAEKLSSEGFDARLRGSDIVAELKKVRNIRPGFNKGLWRGMTTAAIETPPPASCRARCPTTPTTSSFASSTSRGSSTTSSNATCRRAIAWPRSTSPPPRMMRTSRCT